MLIEVPEWQILEAMHGKFGFEIKHNKTVHPKRLYEFLGQRFYLSKHESKALLGRIGFIRIKRGYRFMFFKEWLLKKLTYAI